MSTNALLTSAFGGALRPARTAPGACGYAQPAPGRWSTLLSLAVILAFAPAVSGQGITMIAGTVTDALTGEPIPGIRMRIYESTGGGPVRLVQSGADGGYMVVFLPAGTYFLQAFDPDLVPPTYLSEVYGGVRCYPNPGCDPRTGTPVEVISGEATTGVDFVLDREGMISGTVTDSATGAPILESVLVRVFDAEGLAVNTAYTLLGTYSAGGLYADTYTVTAEHRRFLDELYDAIPCPRGVLNGGCDPVDGTPVAVAWGETPGVDFSLERRGAVTGTVTAAGSGLPLGLLQVEVWNEQGSVAATGPTSGAGTYDLGGLDEGTYFVRTRNLDGYLDEVYDDIPCGDDCDPTLGTPVAVSPDATVTGIDFELERPPCVPRATVLCLNHRFRVEAEWQDFEGDMGPGFARPLTGDTGAFWFFGEENLELMVKVLDACDLPGFDNYWVFAGGLTNVEVVLRVTDAESGEVQVYTNPMGSAFQPIQDTGSFRTCPE